MSKGRTLGQVTFNQEIGVQIMTREYSEDRLIEQTAIDLFFNQLGWDTLLAYNKETFGEDGTLGRLNKKEVVIKKQSWPSLSSLIPAYPSKPISWLMKN